MSASKTDNELIAEFMGAKHGTSNLGEHWLFETPPTVSAGLRWTYLCYADSWDWLMPVVEKISKSTFEWESKFESGTDSHYLRTFGMIDEETGRVMVRINNCGLHFGETLIEATYNAVVEFIKQDNQNHGERI